MDYLASLERLGDFLGRSVEMKAYTATAMTVRIHLGGGLGGRKAGRDPHLAAIRRSRRQC